VMLEQISRISQQIGYYLHRASMRSGSALLSRELHPVAPLLDNLTSALNKVYQRKGVNISLDISPEISFVGEKNDLFELLGNLLDNAHKFAISEIRLQMQTTAEGLRICLSDDGPGVPEALRERIRQQVRQHCTARHVPARILQVDAIPRTKSGKIVELAVREVVHNRPVNNTHALADPEVLNQYRGRPELAS